MTSRWRGSRPLRLIFLYGSLLVLLRRHFEAFSVIFVFFSLLLTSAQTFSHKRVANSSWFHFFLPLLRESVLVDSLLLCLCFFTARTSRRLVMLTLDIGCGAVEIWIESKGSPLDEHQVSSSSKTSQTCYIASEENCVRAPTISALLRGSNWANRECRSSP